MIDKYNYTAQRVLTNWIIFFIVSLTAYLLFCYLVTDFAYVNTTDKYAYQAAVAIALIAALLTKSSLNLNEKLIYYIRLSVKCTLCYLLIYYSLSKLMGVMFTNSISELDAPLGAARPITLCWRFFGANWQFMAIIAAGQLLAGIFLFSKKYQYFAAIAAFLLLAFIFVLDIFYITHLLIPVSMMLLLCLYLLTPVWSSIENVLLNKKQVLPFAPALTFFNKKAKAINVVLIIFFISLSSFISYQRTYKMIAPYLRPTILFGGWKVKSALLLSDSSWSKLYFEEDNTCVIKLQNETLLYATFSLDTIFKKISIKDENSILVNSAYILQTDKLSFTKPGNDTVLLQKFTIPNLGIQKNMFNFFKNEK